MGPPKLKAWIGAALLLISAPARADADAHVALMAGGVEKIIYLPVVLADRLGFYREQGLTVELQSEPVGGEAGDDLLAGVVDGVVGFYDHTIDLQARGKFVEAIVVIGQTPGEAELVSTRLADRIRSPADFKGLALGVTGLGSSTVLLTQYLALDHGVALRDLTLVPVGAGDPFIDAMRQGRIDVGMTTEPTISRALKSGTAQLLVDLRTPDGTRQALGGMYPGACLYVTSAWAASHRQSAERLAKGVVEALHYIAGHSAEEIAEIVPAAYLAGDKSAYVSALAANKAWFTADGKMPVDGPPRVLTILSDVSPNLRNKPIDLSRTHTDEFVDKAQ